MIFIWGRKTFRRPDGIAADFCSICRRATPVNVAQIRSQSHIYYIGLGSGEIVGAVCQCRICGSEWVMQAGTVWKTVPAQNNPPIDTLIEETFPRLSIVYSERLAQEEILRHNPFALDTNTRFRLIAEPFFILDNTISQYEHQTPSWERVVSVFCGIIAVLFGVTALPAFIDATNMILAWALLIATIVAGWGAFVLDRKGKRRFMQTKIYPNLASCLAPVCPTPDELAMVLKSIKSKSAKLTVADELLPLLRDNDSPARLPEGVKAL